MYTTFIHAHQIAFRTTRDYFVRTGIICLPEMKIIGYSEFKNKVHSFVVEVSYFKKKHEIPILCPLLQHGIYQQELNLNIQLFVCFIRLELRNQFYELAEIWQIIPK